LKVEPFHSPTPGAKNQIVASDADTYTTAALTPNSTYYVEAVSAISCKSATCRQATVTVAPLPAVPAADAVTVCAGSHATLSVIALDYQWYDAAQGGNLLASGSTFTSPTALYGNTTYYVQALNSSGCASASRQAVQVRVVALPATPLVANVTACSGTGTTLFAMALRRLSCRAACQPAAPTSFTSGNRASTA